LHRLTSKAAPPPTRDVNRDSGTASANGGWLRRLRPNNQCICLCFRRKYLSPDGVTLKLTTLQPSATGVLSISSLVLGPTVLYCHFVACSVVQQPANNKVLAATVSARCFFMVCFCGVRFRPNVLARSPPLSVTSKCNPDNHIS
jgi:hypothetical protein